MKKSVYLTAFQYVVSNLSNQYQLIDSGFDWLRFKTFSINPEIDFLFNSFNSTTWPAIIDSNEYYSSILLSSSSVWPALFFQKKIELKNWIVENFTILRVLKNEKNSTYLIDFYWLFFWLRKSYENQLLDVQDYLDYLSIDSFSVTRVDYNFNYIWNGKIVDLNNYILEKYKIKNYASYNWDSFSFWLYEKKWKRDWKTLYRLTKSFWFRLYDKTKNIVDLWLQQVYPQYLYNTIRVELVCGSDVFSGFFSSFSDFENYFLTFLKNWWLSVEKRKVRNIKKSIEPSNFIKKDLNKKKLDLLARLHNYLIIGWSLTDLLVSYNVDNKYVDYLLENNYLKAFSLIEKQIQKKLEKFHKKNKSKLRKIKNDLFRIKVLLLNLDE